MHGMICKSLETFLRAHHGDAVWADVCRAARMDGSGFESMRIYPDRLYLTVVSAAADRLGRPVSALMEDVGTWICTHPPLEAVRRLIRFSGPTYEDLIWSLEELEDRARLALPDLDFPRCEVEEIGDGRFDVTVSWPIAGAAAVMTGMLRAMADDYGVLAVLDRTEREWVDDLCHETIEIMLVETQFATPRDFVLGTSA